MRYNPLRVIPGSIALPVNFLWTKSGGYEFAGMSGKCGPLLAMARYRFGTDVDMSEVGEYLKKF